MLLLKLFFAFIQVGMFSVGGGYAAIPRFGRYFRIGLRSGVCVRFPGERFGGVHVHFQRHQFLYGAAGKFGRLVCLSFSQSKSINQ